MSPMGSHGARLTGVLVALLVMAGCSTASNRDVDLARSCGSLGLTPGTDAHANCMERLQLQQQLDLDRVRQVRELDRGSSRL